MTTEQEQLLDDLVRAYYGPLGRDVDDDLDPDDLAECRRAMKPVAHLVAARVAEAKAEVINDRYSEREPLVRLLSLVEDFAWSRELPKNALSGVSLTVSGIQGYRNAQHNLRALLSPRTRTGGKS